MFADDKTPYAMLSMQEQRTIGEIKALVGASYYILGASKCEILNKAANDFIKVLESELP